MAGGGGGGAISPATKKRRTAAGKRHQAQAAAPRLPLDLIAEIAARSDPATLVRCAATCRAVRRRIAEDANLRGRLRLRHTGRFVLPLLRAHLLLGTSSLENGRSKTKVYMVDTTTAADTTSPAPVEATFLSAAAEAENLMDPMPIDSRGGLVLVRATATATATAAPPPSGGLQHQVLLVCNPATGHHLVLPPDVPFPALPGSERTWHILLVGDRDYGAAAAAAVVGRPFQVLKVSSCYDAMWVQTFSSEHGAWSPRTEIPMPPSIREIRYPSWHWQSLGNFLVVGDVVHWLYLSQSAHDYRSFVVTLHVKELRVSEAALPESFPRPYDARRRRTYLLATDSAGGSPVVLVANAKNIRVWEQCKRGGGGGGGKGSAWKVRPKLLIEREAIMGFNDQVAKLHLHETMKRQEGQRWRTNNAHVPELVCFAERSGAVLLRVYFDRCLLWLDLHSKKIVRCFLPDSSDHRLQYVHLRCPYEEDLSTWVPTFSSAIVTI